MKIIKSKIKMKIDCQCPFCGKEFRVKDLIPYYGSGFTPSDLAYICPNCRNVSPLCAFKGYYLQEDKKEWLWVQQQ